MPYLHWPKPEKVKGALSDIQVRAKPGCHFNYLDERCSDKALFEIYKVNLHVVCSLHSGPNPNYDQADKVLCIISIRGQP
jgi:hypothetical protein